MHNIINDNVSGHDHSNNNHRPSDRTDSARSSCKYNGNLIIDVVREVELGVVIIIIVLARDMAIMIAAPVITVSSSLLLSEILPILVEQ